MAVLDTDKPGMDTICKDVFQSQRHRRRCFSGSDNEDFFNIGEMVLGVADVQVVMFNPAMTVYGLFWINGLNRGLKDIDGIGVHGMGI